MRKIYVQNKHKGGNQNKVHKPRTVENIKYEPILITLGHITRKLGFEKLGENSSPWAKFDPLRTTIF